MNYVFQWESRHPQIDSDEGMGNGYGHVVQKLMFFVGINTFQTNKNNHTMLQPPQKSKPIIIPQLPSILKNATRPFKSSEYTSYSSLDDIKPQSIPNSPIVSESIPKTKSRLFACGSGFCLWPSSSEPNYPQYTIRISRPNVGGIIVGANWWKWGRIQIILYNYINSLVEKLTSNINYINK